MVALADQNSSTYVSKFGTYSAKNGYEPSDLAESLVQDGWFSCLVEELFHEDLWKLDDEPKVKEMSIEDIERELGYRVRIVDPEPKKKEVSPERKREINEAIDCFQRVFGISLDPEDYM